MGDGVLAHTGRGDCDTGENVGGIHGTGVSCRLSEDDADVAPNGDLLGPPGKRDLIV